jgi:hypothetical protein
MPLCGCRQLPEHAGDADVAGMQNQVDVSQPFRDTAGPAFQNRGP